MTNMEVLDRPVWASLQTGWAPLADGGARALRLNQNYGPFGAAADETLESLGALADVIPPDGELWLVQRPGIVAPPGATIRKSAPVTQMVAERIDIRPHDVQFVALGEEDAAEMLALALLTVPGPFAALTHRLGRFIGIKHQGRLVAMAGERMSIPGFREVSGVCTHPDHRGRGYAGFLMSAVAQRILEEGETPFLHAYASNEMAIALYERLGFRTRAAMIMAVLSHEGRGYGNKKLASPYE